MITPSIAGARYAGLALLAGGLIAGCAASDAPMTAPQDPGLVQVFGIFDPVAGFVSAGIYSGPAGDYTVRTSVVGGGDYALTGDRTFSFATQVNDVTGRSGYVYLQANQPSWLIAPTATLTVGEIALPPGTHVDSIKVLYNGVFLPTAIGPSSVTFTVGYFDVAQVKFFNSVAITPPPPPPITACTPGYWKQLQHFDSWPGGYLPTQLISSRFSAASLYTSSKLGNLGSLTLVQGLSLPGGPGPVGSAQILLRAGVAALLNARNSALSYPMTEAQVISAMNAVLAGGDRDAMLTLSMRLDQYNNARCPLN